MACRTALLLGLLPLVAGLAGCAQTVEGDGVFAERFIGGLAPFDRIDASIAIEALVTSHASFTSVVLSGDQNLLGEIEVKVSGTTLEARTDLHGFTSVHPLRLVVSVPDVVAARATGGARVTVSAAAATDFQVEAEGASQVTLAGPGGGTLAVRLRDRSSCHAFDYPVAGATLEVADGSTVQVRTGGTVVGTAAGGAHGASVVEVAGGGTCGLTLSGGATCGPASP